MSVIGSGVHIITPSACTIAAGSSVGSLSAGAYQYKITLVSSFGESLPSVASNSIVALTSSTMVLTAIPVGPDNNTIKRNIYRTIAGGASFLFVAAINDNKTTTYTDSLSDVSLGVAAPSSSTADSLQIVNGYVSFQQPFQQSVLTGLTALSGGGQSGATLLGAGVNNVTTVAVGGDSCILPALNANLIGLNINAKNNGANSMNIFANGTNTINSLGSGVALAVGAGAVARLYAVSATNWQAF